METGVPGGKPLQRILGQMAYTSPAAYRSPLSLLSLWGVAIRFKIKIPVRLKLLMQKPEHRILPSMAHNYSP